MASGVKVDSECIEAFNNFKLGKKEAFLLFSFNENATKIVIKHKEPIGHRDDTLKSKNAQWDTLISLLPTDDVRYAVADVHYNTTEGQRTDMVFLTWAPETASIKRRMLMASSKDALRNALVGIRSAVQACSYPDLDLRSVVEKFKGTLDY
jgi:cofilin